MSVEPGPIVGILSVGIFLRDPSQYLSVHGLRNFSLFHLPSVLYAEWYERPTRLTREYVYQVIVRRKLEWKSVFLIMGRPQVRFLAWSRFRIVGLKNYSAFSSCFSEIIMAEEWINFHLILLFKYLF